MGEIGTVPRGNDKNLKQSENIFRKYVWENRDEIKRDSSVSVNFGVKI